MSDDGQAVDLLSAEVPYAMAGQRLDQVAALLFDNYSRARLQAWICEGKLTVDRQRRRSKDKVTGGEHLELLAEVEAQARWQPQQIALEIVYEDESLIIINKPAGLVVHPAVGNPEGTLLNALLHHAPELNKVPRAGIVHRLDKETTGLLVVAKTLLAQKSLVEQLQSRTVGRLYEAVVAGTLISGGTVDEPMGRHPVDRKRMAVVHTGKAAITHYRITERFRDYTRLGVKLETGRTHQIRVHMAHLHHPLVGDPVYGGRLRLPKGASEQLLATLRGFRRQALHAGALELFHPESGELCQWQAPLPRDMVDLLARLRLENGV